MKSLRIKVLGKVQGVNFRQSIKRLCDQVGLVGQVKNIPDGSVEILVVGPDIRVQQLIDWCHIGPPRAVVEKLFVEEVPASTYIDFTIVR